MNTTVSGVYLKESLEVFKSLSNKKVLIKSYLKTETSFPH